MVHTEDKLLNLVRNGLERLFNVIPQTVNSSIPLTSKLAANGTASLSYPNITSFLSPSNSYKTDQDSAAVVLSHGEIPTSSISCNKMAQNHSLSSSPRSPFTAPKLSSSKEHPTLLSDVSLKSSFQIIEPTIDAQDIISSDDSKSVSLKKDVASADGCSRSSVNTPKSSNVNTPKSSNFNSKSTLSSRLGKFASPSMIKSRCMDVDKPVENGSIDGIESKYSFKASESVDEIIEEKNTNGKRKSDDRPDSPMLKR